MILPGLVINTIRTLTPRTLGDTRSERSLNRLDKLCDAVSVRDRPVDLQEKTKIPQS